MRRTVVLMAAISAVCFGRIIHVPAEYPTIQQGIDAAAAGDIVMVAAGRYVEEIQLKAGVVVQGAGEGRSIIDGNNDPGDVVRATGNSIRNDCKLIGFTVTGALNSGGMPGGGGLFCNSGAQPEVANCRFEGNDCGIALWNGSAAFIHNCVVAGNVYDGISTGSYATVVNNTIHANRVGFYDNSGYGPVFMNNIVTGNRLYGIYGPSGGTPPQLTYNDVWGNATDYQQAVPGIGSISREPLYADTAAGDFRLQPGSPCIDSGNPDSQYNDPDGSRNDMGAYGGPDAVSNRPAVTSLDPAMNALNVPPDVTVEAGFNVGMNPATLTAQSVRLLGAFSGWHTGNVEYDSSARVVTLVPAGSLLAGEVASAFLTRSIVSSEGDSLAGFGWSFTARASGGSGRFVDPVAYSVTGSPLGAVTARLNSDNHLDLAVVDRGNSSVDVLLGNGDGTFQECVPYSVGTEPQALCIADFNADSALDIAAASPVTGSIAILLGNGDGTFRPAVHYPAGDSLQGICYADFNGDARLDLAATCAALDSVAVLLGNGDGTFASVTRWAVGAGPAGIVPTDCDCDGFTDLLVTSRSSGTLDLLKGSGDGRFAPAASFAAGAAPEGIAAGDFNHDGNADVAIADPAGDSVSVLLGNGRGGFGGRTGFTGCSNPTAILVADLNADGRLDLVVAGREAEMAVFLGRGNGTFVLDGNYPVGNDVHALACGDFDSDGGLDVVLTNRVAATCEVLLNRLALDVVAAIPPPNSTGASETTSVAVTFNQAVAGNSLNAATFRVYAARSGLHPGAISYDTATLTATLRPSAAFATGEPVTAMLTTSVRSRSGVNLRGFGWSFNVGIGLASNGTFGDQNVYSTGSEVRGAWAADFDSDGDIDLVATCNSPAAVALLRNNGDGTFASPAYVSVNSDPISLSGADFDSDGDIDLACFHNQPGTSHLEILKNDGSGSFVLHAEYAPAVLGQHVTGADFDADGDIDLILSDGWGSQDNVKVMVNDGTGSFADPVSYSAGSWARGAACFDADNDGDFDIAVANAGNNSVSVLYNDGTGDFSQQADFEAGASATRVCADDFDGDGSCDLAVANYGEDSVAVLWNDGSGVFSSCSDFPCGAAAQAVCGGDFDGDSDIDLCLSAMSANSLAVLRNNGDGTFAAPVLYPVGILPWDCFTADFNFDGALDLGCANCSSGTISVLFGAGLGVADTSGGERRALIVPTVVRNVLLLPESATPHSSFVLLNSVGCRVMDLASGPNDVRQLAPGVYFVRQGTDNRTAARKVVLAR